MGHHYVPRRYLKGFESPEKPGWIWMFDKQKETAKHLPIKEVAQEAGFYDDDVEIELNEQVEKPGNDVIDKIRGGRAIDEMERKHLTYYVATMMRRVPASRTRSARVAPQALREVADEVRAWIRNGRRDGRISEATLEKRLAELSVLEEKFQEQPPREVIAQIKTPWPFESMLIVIHSMYWRLVKTKGPSYFLTCDNPAPFFEGFGLQHPEAELIMPLCTDLLIHCAWQRCRDMVVEQATEKLVKEFNRRIASGAERFVFYHRDAPWVLNVAKCAADQCKKVHWV